MSKTLDYIALIVVFIGICGIYLLTFLGRVDQEA